MQTVIETKSLCKQYGTRMAVDHVELHVPQGCVYGFIGPNGAGKSTTMKMLLGLIHPTSGSVRLLGQPLTRESRLALLRQTGSLIENPAGYLHLTAQENLEIVARMQPGGRDVRVQERVRKALGMVGLGAVEARYPAELSQGECRRVELARAIINNPAILVLDELLANLDEDTIWDILHLLSECNRLGTTIIMATHAKKFVNMLRKRVITLVDGRIFGDVQKGRYGDVV